MLAGWLSLTRSVRLLAVALVLASGLCAAQSAPTSDPAPPPADAASPPASSTTPTTETPAPPPPPPPRVDGPPIVLVLPLASPDYARAAEAVRDGFLAAADEAGASKRVRVIAHEDGQVLAAFDDARDGGARVIVGPLVRDDLRALAESGREFPVTVALNQLDDAAAMPPRMYSFALAIESDARSIARRMRGEGLTQVAVITDASPLMRRFASAFLADWLLAGGAEPVQRTLVATPDGLSALRRDLARLPLDGLVIAVEGGDAALVKTFAPRVAAWASGQVYARQDLSAIRDLDEVRFVDVAWLVAPDSGAYARLKRPDYPTTALDRLYALGIDAFRVAQAFVDAPPAELAFDGATGRVVLGDSRQIQREGRLATFRSGRVVPLDDQR